eukprot:scpid96087/ scgid13560/ 
MPMRKPPSVHLDDQHAEEKATCASTKHALVSYCVSPCKESTAFHFARHSDIDADKGWQREVAVKQLSSIMIGFEKVMFLFQKETRLLTSDYQVEVPTFNILS